MTVKYSIIFFLQTFLFILSNLPADTLPLDLNPEKTISSSALKSQSSGKFNASMNELINEDALSSGLDSTSNKHLMAYFQTTQSLTITNLHGGLTSSINYKITNNGLEYVLRILNPTDSMEQNQHEIQAAVYAGELGVGPCIRYISPEYDAIIMDFVAGQTFSSNLVQHMETLPVLLRTIRQLHESTGDFPQGNTIFETIRQKLKKISQGPSPISSNRFNKVIKRLQVIEKKFKSQSLVPCHNDLNALNIIKNQNGYKLIDWTDSSMSYAYIDLGFFALTNNIHVNQHPEFLSLYLERSPSTKELDLLKLGVEVAALRLFTTTFSDHEPYIENEQQRLQRQAELEQMLEDPLLPTIDHFIDLQSKGLLNNNDVVISLCLCALHLFLNKEFP